MTGIHRVMKHDQDDPAKPMKGDSFGKLGVRVPKDIEADADGNVRPCNKGMSVQRSPQDIPAAMLPKKYARLVQGAAGRNDSSVWLLGKRPFQEQMISPAARMTLTKPSHGVVGPAAVMSVPAFQQALGETQPEWVQLEPPKV